MVAIEGFTDKQEMNLLQLHNGIRKYLKDSNGIVHTRFREILTWGEGRSRLGTINALCGFEFVDDCDEVLLLRSTTVELHLQA
jgi:hypothetical protein